MSHLSIWVRMKETSTRLRQLKRHVKDLKNTLSALHKRQEVGKHCNLGAQNSSWKFRSTDKRKMLYLM